MTPTNDAPAQAPSGSGVREALDWLDGFNAYRAGPCAQDVRTAFVSGWMHRAEQETSLASEASPRGEAVAWAQTGYESQLARYGAFPMRSEKDETLGYVEPIYAHPAPAPAPAEVVRAMEFVAKSAEDAHAAIRNAMSLCQIKATECLEENSERQKLRLAIFNALELPTINSGQAAITARRILRALASPATRSEEG